MCVMKKEESPSFIINGFTLLSFPRKDVMLSINFVTLLCNVLHQIINPFTLQSNVCDEEIDG